MTRDEAIDQVADEESPLLADSTKTTDESESPIAQELPLPQLVAVLLSVWVRICSLRLSASTYGTCRPASSWPHSTAP
jgi:hypothetical protein